MKITINTIGTASYAYSREQHLSFKEYGYKTLEKSSSNKTDSSFLKGLHKVARFLNPGLALAEDIVKAAISSSNEETEPPKEQENTYTQERASYSEPEKTTENSHSRTSSYSSTYTPSYSPAYTPVYHSYESTAEESVNAEKTETSEKTNHKKKVSAPKVNEQDNELAEASKIYKGLLKQYKELCGKECDRKFIYNWHSWDLPLLKTRTTELQEEIPYQEMVQNAVKAISQGSDGGIPPEDKSVFDLSNLEEIVPVKENNYNSELKRMYKIFLKNSEKADDALFVFSKINKINAQFAAEWIKEIFALQNDKKNKMLERIPKLGLIPKALRVTEQIMLTRFISKDYEEFSEKYVNGGINPFIEKYHSQYMQIVNYINENSTQKIPQQEKLTEEITKIIDSVKQKRMQADYKLINSYASNRMNVENICKRVKTKGIIDVARKTAVTFASFF